MWSESREGSSENNTLWATVVAPVMVVLAVLILFVVFVLWASNQLGFTCHCCSTNVPSAGLFKRQQPTSSSQESLDLVGE